MKKKRTKILLYFMGLLTLLFVFFPKWLNITFDGFTFEQVVFNITMVTGDTNMEALVIFIKDFTPYFLVYTVMMFLFLKMMDAKLLPKLTIKIKSKNFIIKPLSYKVIKSILLLSLVLSGIYMGSEIQLFDFIRKQLDRSMVIEENYTDPNDVVLTFPSQKRNVIHLVLESMETDFSNINVDGKTVNLIPNLTQLANDNYVISDKEGGGLLRAPGAGFTVASLVAQTSGMPLKVASGNRYGDENEFLPGITTFGEILNHEGYRNVFLLGSDANFAGRSTYYGTHGNYDVMDLAYMRESGAISEDYKVFWGYEDQKLFKYAQETLLELSAADQPFNMEILTVDTHFMDGYVDDSCALDYSIPYANAIACSDVKIKQFIDWVQAQDFYEDTTIVITGDHPTMNAEFMSDFNFDDRRVYNVIINPAQQPLNFDNRLATAMDIFPTMLGAMGVDIEGDYLGLGVNLFSESPTLSEKLGQEYYFNELSKISTFYNKRILKGIEEK